MDGVKKRVGLVGCGAIGSSVAEFIVEQLSDYVDLVAFCDLLPKRMADLAEQLGLDVQQYENYDFLVNDVDFVIEAASMEISGDLASSCLADGTDILVISVGGLVGREELLRFSEGASLYVPSGAIAGLDFLSAAQVGGVESISLVTRKPPRALQGAPYLEKKGIVLKEDGSEQVVFEGSAVEAIRAFPKNINVAALLTLFGVPAENVSVSIVSSSAYKKNSHEVRVKGPFGELVSQTINEPHPKNPKTSYLAVLSACAMLKKIFSPLKIGT